MVRRVPFLRAAFVAVGLLFGVAAQADAGLDFTDEVTVSATSGTALFNGSGAVAFNTSGPAGGAWQLAQHGGGPVTITDTGGGILSATLQFTYNPTIPVTGTGISSVDYNTTNAYDFFINISSVVGASWSLTTIGVTDNLLFSLPVGPGPLSSPLPIAASATPTLLHLSIPTVGPGSIPAGARTQVTSVALQFQWLGGVGASITVDAVANPEPSTMALFGLGIMGLGAGIVRRRRKRRAAAAA